MPIVREPNPLPSPLDYVPPSSVPYRVKNGDTWWTLADTPGPRTKGLSASDLCYFNFKTRRASEINWYLRHKVGCTHITKNGKNYVFSQADNPGVVYLPNIGTQIPAPEVEESKLDTRIWIGVAGKAGTTFVVVGIETIVSLCMSIDHPDRWMSVTGSGTRLGPGFGVSGGVAVMIVSGVKYPSQLNGHMQGEMDWNVALGAKFGKIVKAATSTSKYAPLVRFITRVGAKTPRGFREFLLKNPDKIADLLKLVKTNKEAWGLSNDEPNVLFIDIPAAGGGTEISIYHAVTEFNAFELTDG